MKGTVKWFDTKNHTGYVNASDGNEYYFDRAYIKGSLDFYHGDLVEFHLEPGGLVGTKVIKKIWLVEKSDYHNKVKENVITNALKILAG